MGKKSRDAGRKKREKNVTPTSLCNTVNNEPPQPRFGLQSFVLCACSDGWEEAVVDIHWWSEDRRERRGSTYVPYRCLLSNPKHASSPFIIVPADDDDCIQSCICQGRWSLDKNPDVTHQQVLFEATSAGCNVTHLSAIQCRLSANLQLIAPEMLRRAAASSNSAQIIIWLADHVRTQFDIRALDASGASILHIAAKAGQLTQVSMCLNLLCEHSFIERDQLDELCVHRDAAGASFLHVLVQHGSFEHAKAFFDQEFAKSWLMRHLKGLEQPLRKLRRQQYRVLSHVREVFLYEWEDLEQMTALDYASRANAEEGLSQLIQDFGDQQDFKFMFGSIDDDGRYMFGYIDDKARTPLVFTERWQHWGRDVKAEASRDVLLGFMFEVASTGDREMVQYLVKDWTCVLSNTTQVCCYHQGHCEPTDDRLMQLEPLDICNGVAIGLTDCTAHGPRHWSSNRKPLMEERNSRAYNSREILLNWELVHYNRLIIKEWDDASAPDWDGNMDLVDFLSNKFRSTSRDDLSKVEQDAQPFLRDKIFDLSGLDVASSQTLIAWSQQQLESRLDTLDWLVTSQGLAPPTLVSVLLWRQWGVLKWMVDAGHCNLDAEAQSDQQGLCLNAQQISLVRNFPAEITSGQLLCLITVAQGCFVQWLVQSFAAQVPLTDSWNLLHYAAAAGNIEACKWFVVNDTFDAKLCTDQQLNAAHLAAGHGHIYLAERLVEAWGCPQLDGNGLDLFWHALESQNPKAVAWANKNIAEKKKGADLVRLGTLAFDVENDAQMDAITSQLDTGCLSARALSFYFNHESCFPDLMAYVWHKEDGLTLKHIYERLVALGIDDEVFVPLAETLRRFAAENCVCGVDSGEIFLSWNTIAVEHGHQALTGFLQAECDAIALQAVCNDQLTEIESLIVEGADIHVIEEQIAAVLDTAGRCSHDLTDLFEYRVITTVGHLSEVRHISEAMKGKTPLEYAAAQGYTHIVEWAIHIHQSNPDTLKGSLVAAAASLQLEVITLLLPEVKFAEHVLLALISAIKHSNLEVVQVLYDAVLQMGADVNMVVSTTDQRGNVEDQCILRLDSKILWDVEKVSSEPDEIVDMRYARALRTTEWLVKAPAVTVRDITMDHLFDALNCSARFLKSDTRLMDKQAQHVLDVLKLLMLHNFDVSRLKRHEHVKECFKIRTPGLVLPILRYFAEDLSLDVQSQDPYNELSELSPEIARLQQEQLERWKLVEAIDQQVPLDCLKQLATSNIVNATDKTGRGMLHVAALTDRLEVAKWLVDDLGANIDQLDWDRRTPLQVAEQAGSSQMVSMLREPTSRLVLARFCQTNYQRRKGAVLAAHRAQSIVRIQSAWRSYACRHLHFNQLVAGLVERHQFFSVWRPAVDALDRLLKMESLRCTSWADLKLQNDMIVTPTNSEDAALTGLLHTLQPSVEAPQSAVSNAECEGAFAEDNADQLVEHSGDNISPVEEHTADLPMLDNIKWTRSVVQWFDRADTKYRSFLCRRIHQLACGQRSHILNKRLTGCRHTIFETYLEQASANRILWTECKEVIPGVTENRASILIWFVSSHKKVSVRMRQIDEALGRLNRQAKGAVPDGGADAEPLMLQANTVLLDPEHNVPLKIYEFPRAEIECLENTDWTPALRMTGDERLAIEKAGTVLLLGRSGTGKTLCVSNRMSRDRRFWASTKTETPLKQLFVARSGYICDLVCAMQKHCHSPPELDFTTFVPLDRFMQERCRSIPRQGARRLFCRNAHIGYLEFKRDVYPKVRKKCALDPLVIWTQIRTFIRCQSINLPCTQPVADRGSIEASMQNQHLDRAQYLALGKSRCRLDAAQRSAAYDAFEIYMAYCDEHKCWDDLDRVFDIFDHFPPAGWKPWEIDGPPPEHCYHRVYVDEVQDYTQAEMALLFMISSPGGLFLAGDTAQSVEHGVTFRFTEVRSVVYQLTGGDMSRVPDKPMKLCLNFRSHSGVLNVAAAVLDLLAVGYPGAVDKLPGDEGLCQGPRPGLYQLHGDADLARVLRGNERVVVLSRDEIVDSVKAICGTTRTVLSIRDSKGLEFPEVAIVNFFCSMEHQRSFKQLLDAAVTTGDDTPELECELKLLYTAVTRCQDRLVLIETQKSVAASAFFQWLRKEGLAENRSIMSEAATLMTSDEWRVRGIEFAMRTEAVFPQNEQSVDWLHRALACFNKANDSALCARVRTLLSAVALCDSIERGPFGPHAISAVARTVRALLLDEMPDVAISLCRFVAPYLSDHDQELLTIELIERVEGSLSVCV